MNFPAFILMILSLAAIISIEMNKPPQIAADFIVVGSDKVIKQIDSVSRIDYDVNFLFIQNDGDTIRID